MRVSKQTHETEARRGDDVRAERGLQFGRDQTTLPGVLGVLVVDFPLFPPDRKTSCPRLERSILALARRRGLLV